MLRYLRLNPDLSDCYIGDAGGAVGVGAGEGEDFVQFLADGGGLRRHRWG